MKSNMNFVKKDDIEITDDYVRIGKIGITNDLLETIADLMMEYKENKDHEVTKEDFIIKPGKDDYYKSKALNDHGEVVDVEFQIADSSDLYVHPAGLICNDTFIPTNVLGSISYKGFELCKKLGLQKIEE